MNNRKFFREAQATIASVAPVVGMEHGGSHYKFRIRTPHGERMLVCPASPSDRFFALRVLRRNARHLMEGRRETV